MFFIFILSDTPKETEVQENNLVIAVYVPEVSPIIPTPTPTPFISLTPTPIYETKLWLDKESKYPAAAAIWKYMKTSLNWSDAACAGALGNMMEECGGQTFNIQWGIYNSYGHYGICQWSPKYYPEVMGLDLIGQLDFIANGIEQEFKTFGYMYQENFVYEDFLKLETPEEATVAFAKVYERCGPYYDCSQRIKNAQMAYDYFKAD